MRYATVSVRVPNGVEIFFVKTPIEHLEAALMTAAQVVLRHPSSSATIEVRRGC